MGSTRKNSKRQSSQPKRPHKKFNGWPPKAFRSWLYIYGALIIASAVAAATIASRYDPPLADPFTGAQRKHTTFQLYYPDRLPGLLQVDDASLIGDDNQIVAMRLTDGRGKGYAFLLNQQQVPPNFNFDTFYSSFGNRQDIKTRHGTAITGTIDDGRTRLASLVTEDNTWVLIQAPLSVKVDDIIQVLQHLVASK